MQALNDETILDALGATPLESTGFTLSDFSAIEIVSREGEANKLSVRVSLGVPLDSNVTNLIKIHLYDKAATMGLVLSNIEFVFNPPRMTGGPISQVKQIIAVASGKGGVGKSTTATNIALALASMGAQVGLMDADIYGPSQPMMLGVKEGTRPEVVDQNFFVPIKAHGIYLNSMGLLVTDKTPMVWRGPMATGALQQLLLQTKWPELDYLIIDMPPGTGDIHLTLAQQATLSGAVVVTTPQDIAVLDAKKGIEMFNKVNVPLLGVVENMATFKCPNCNHESQIFGESGAEKIAAEYGVPVLGQLPLNADIRSAMDEGLPITVRAPESELAKHYRDIAAKLAMQLWLYSLKHSDQPEIEVVND